MKVCLWPYTHILSHNSTLTMSDRLWITSTFSAPYRSSTPFGRNTVSKGLAEAPCFRFLTSARKYKRVLLYFSAKNVFLLKNFLAMPRTVVLRPCRSFASSLYVADKGTCIAFISSNRIIMTITAHQIQAKIERMLCGDADRTDRLKAL